VRTSRFRSTGDFSVCLVLSRTPAVWRRGGEVVDGANGLFQAYTACGIGAARDRPRLYCGETGGVNPSLVRLCTAAVAAAVPGPDLAGQADVREQAGDGLLMATDKGLFTGLSLDNPVALLPKRLHRHLSIKGSLATIRTLERGPVT
jgi:hypothetical protein